MKERLKERLPGHWVCSVALSLRNRYELLQTLFYSKQELGMVANDHQATQLVTRICQPRKTFIDVGAHIGSIISEVARNDKTVKIFAIEATPEKAKRLRRRFPSIVIHGCAAGNCHGEASFFINTEHSGYNSLVERFAEASGALTEIKVPVRRLDDLITSDDVDVIKIDVEGAELSVLQGSSQLLGKCRPIIMFESAPCSNEKLRHTKEALYEFLDVKDFAILVPNRVPHRDAGLTLDGFIECHLYPRRTTNFFAVPRERRDEVRDRARVSLSI